VFTDKSDRHPKKLFDPIVSTQLGTEIVERPLIENAFEQISRSFEFASIETDSRLQQKEKQLEPRISTELGSEILRKLVHPMNAFLQIVFNQQLSSNVTVISDVQWLKQPFPNASTFDGRWTSFTNEKLKRPSPISMGGKSSNSRANRRSKTSPGLCPGPDSDPDLAFGPASSAQFHFSAVTESSLEVNSTRRE
jgi:hypothetical protein